MDNKEFRELSEKEVTKLNGSDKEEAFEAWRAGYNYVRKIIHKHSQEDFADEFINNMVELSEGELREYYFEHE